MIASTKQSVFHFPLRLIQRGIDALRAGFVYLTMAFVIGTGWLMAWSHSINPGNHRMVVPALRRDEFSRLIRERNERRMEIGKPVVSSDLAHVPIDNGD